LSRVKSLDGLRVRVTTVFTKVGRTASDYVVTGLEQMWNNML